MLILGECTKSSSYFARQQCLSLFCVLDIPRYGVLVFKFFR